MRRDIRSLPAPSHRHRAFIFTTNFETNFDYASDRGNLVFYYRQYARLVDHWRQVLRPAWFFEVDYEALVSDPEPHTRRLVAACGLD